MQFLQKLGPKSEFSKNILKLLSSTVFASAINFLTIPIITRLYSPEEYGLYQLFLSIVLLLGMITSLKYELTIVLPRKEEDQNNMAIISLIVLVAVSLVFFLLLQIFAEPILRLFDAEKLSDYIMFIPAGIFFTGLLQVCRYVLLQKKKFGDMAKNRIYQISIQQSVSIAGGVFKPHFIGLFIGYVTGTLAPSLLVFSRKLISAQHFNFSEMRRLMIYYKKFPLINTASVFLNNLSLYLPVFMFSRFYDDVILGWYTLANQITVLPISLISTSVAQVYYQAASELYNENPHQLIGLYWRTVKKLLLLGFFTFLGIIVLAPYFTGIIFGKEWTEAGVYMQIVSFGIYFRFVNIPIGSTFFIIDKQEVALILTGLSVIVRYGAMYIFRESPVAMLWALSISSALFYVFYNFLVYWYIRKESEKQN